MVDTITAPREQALLLKRRFELRYEPVLITGRRALIRHLDVSGHPIRKWPHHRGYSSFERLWEEYTSGDALLGVAPDGRVLRFIRTATMNIMSISPETGLPQILVERILWPDGRLSDRRHQNSLSEKLKWSEPGPLYALRRGLEEELGIRTHPYVTHAYPWTHLDVRPTGPYPGVTTYNQLFHFRWNMPQTFVEHEYRVRLPDRTLVFMWDAIDS